MNQIDHPALAKSRWTCDDVVSLVALRTNNKLLLANLRETIERYLKGHPARKVTTGYHAKDSERREDATLSRKQALAVLRAKWPSDYRFRFPPEIELMIDHDFRIGEHFVGSSPDYVRWRIHLIDDKPLPIHDCACFFIGAPTTREYSRTDTLDGEAMKYFEIFDYVLGSAFSGEIDVFGSSDFPRVKPQDFRKIATRHPSAYASEEFCSFWIVPEHGVNEPPRFNQLGAAKSADLAREGMNEALELYDTTRQNFGSVSACLKEVHKTMKKKYTGRVGESKRIRSIRSMSKALRERECTSPGKNSGC